ncbi:hypothetical protein OS175_03165 [Marinicella sp. S1101]|uniref:hypothetical protein n=1 Tax=Marinicella marina TaxID=2996016 RepID=UPI002260BB40|nr:hypothetical protein [Marinicella marina]MCX7552868.1 hypothetical protein [Marinicella marina]MDJ1139823.1 hypothetical protein [Marinicella marina]
MNKLLPILIIAAFLVGCGEDKATTSPTPPEAKQATAEILNYIPADTPMLMTSGLYPEQYPDRYLEVMQGNMDGVVKYLKVVLESELNKEEVVNYVTTIDENGEEVITEDTDPAAAEMKAKIQSFADKWMTDDAMDKLGIKMGETQFAVYMVDLFPVLRMKLSSDNQLNAFMNDLEQDFELSFVKSEVDGKQIREIQNDKVSLLISTDDNYLVITATPAVIKDQMFNQLLGLDKPVQSMAQNTAAIEAVKNKHGFVMDDLLLIDVAKIADHFINPSKYNSAMVNFMQIDDNMLSAACKAEFSAMIAKAPRMVAGSKVMTNDTIEAAFVWEMDAELANDMSLMAGRIPQGNADAAISFGMSFDLLAAKNLASKYVDAAVAEPYNCEHLAPFNAQLQDIQAKLSQPIPPFVGNFKGFNFSLDELKLNMAAAQAENPNAKDIIESLKTQVFLAVDETQALLGMAQMMVPQLQGMDIKTDGSLITLADTAPLLGGSDIPIDLANLYAAVSNNTIGFSMGHEGGGGLETKVQAEGDAILMSSSMNLEGYKAIMEQVFAMADMPQLPAQVRKDLAMQKDLYMSMMYWKSQEMAISFTEQGFTTNVNYTY